MWFGKGLYKEHNFLVSYKFKKLGCIFSNYHKIGKLQVTTNTSRLYCTVQHGSISNFLYSSKPFGLL